MIRSKVYRLYRFSFYFSSEDGFLFLIYNKDQKPSTLICPLSTKSLLRLHGFLLTRLLFFQSLKKPCEQRTPVLAYFLRNMKYFGSQCVALSSIGSSTKPKRTHNICMLNVDYEIYRNFKAVIMVARLGVIIC